MTHVNERGVEDDVGAVVEDVDDGLADPGEAFDGLLDGSGAGSTSHSDDGEKSGGVRELFDGGGGLPLRIFRHGGVMRSR